MITNVYIDGSNLYYRALKDTLLTWIDLRKLAETHFPQDDIHRLQEDAHAKHHPRKLRKNSLVR